MTTTLPEQDETMTDDDPLPTVDLRFGDCLAVLRQLADESVSAVVTDPPYGLAEHKPAALVTALTAWANGDRDHVPDGRGFMGRCVHPDTDILTARGWLPAGKVEIDDEVMSLSPDTGEIEYVPVVKTHAYPFEGELLRVGGRSVRQLVTPNHMVWTVDDGLVRADELPRTFGLANQGTWRGGRSGMVSIGDRAYDPVALGRFLGLWLGDGSVCHRKAQPWKQDFIVFTVVKQRKVEAIRAACRDLHVYFTENVSADGRTSFYVYDKPLRDWLSAMGGAKTKTIPSEVLTTYPPAALEALYQGLIETDGTRQGPKGQELYFTTSEQLADDVQTLCLLTGRSAVKSWREGGPVEIAGRVVESSGGWALSIIQPGKERFWMERDGRARRSGARQPAAVRPVPHRGEVYCVTLARHHVMMTRFEGRPVWTGNSWDAFVPPPAVWDECLRVLKPGGHLLAFAGSRTADLMGLSVRMAGFEIRDTIMWVYGSGFPKSLDVSKAIDKVRDDRADIVRVTSFLADHADARAVTRAQVDEHMGTSDMGGWWLSRLRHRCQVPRWEQWERLRELLGFGDEMDAEVWRLNGRKGTPGEAWTQREVLDTIPDRWAGKGEVLQRAEQQEQESVNITAPATPAAEQWQGWGTALKPAQEPIIIARKPLAGTVAANVLAHGTGGINVDACRVKSSVLASERRTSPRSAARSLDFGMRATDDGERHNLAGRWPANVALSHVGTALYTLKSDVPEQVAEAIRAYYRAGEAVREVRDGVSRDAVGAGEAPVLLAGMRERGPEGRPREGVGDGDLPAVRGDVRDHPGVGAERATEVLLGALPGSREHRQPEPSGEGSQARVPGEDGHEPADGRAVEPVEGRPLPVEGVRVRPGAATAPGDAGRHPVDGAEERLHPGAPGCSCRDAGSCAGSGRCGAPRQRGEDGQPPREPDRDPASGSLRGASGDRAEVPHAPGRAGEAAGGERRLTVPAGAVPPGWLRYFEYAGDVDICTDEEACADGCPVAELDRQSGNAGRTGAQVSRNRVSIGDGEILNGGGAATTTGHGDEGGASRFFPTFRYQAKAPARERPKIDGKGWPTVKPLALMRWLVRLVTPPGGVVLDPFTGSGTTLQAARDEGFASIGIERDEFAYLLTCRRLGLPELVPATVTDAETGEPVALPEVAAQVEVEVEQLPESDPVDPVLAAIAAASSYDELLALWREHRWDKASTYNAAAAARRAEIEEAA